MAPSLRCPPVTIIANGLMVWRTEARLQAILTEIRAAGDPATIADLAPKPVPDDRNDHPDRSGTPDS